MQVGEAAIEPLLKALGSKNRETQISAARALALIGNKRAFEPIVKLLAHADDVILKYFLINALGELRDVRAIGVLLPYLQARLQIGTGSLQEQHDRQQLIYAAAEALGAIGTVAVVEPLIEALSKDPVWFVRRSAVHGLRQMKYARVIEALQLAMNDQNQYVRDAVAAALKDITEAPGKDQPAYLRP